MERDYLIYFINYVSDRDYVEVEKKKGSIPTLFIKTDALDLSEGKLGIKCSDETGLFCMWN